MLAERPRPGRPAPLAAQHPWDGLLVRSQASPLAFFLFLLCCIDDASVCIVYYRTIYARPLHQLCNRMMLTRSEPTDSNRLWIVWGLDMPAEDCL